LTEFLYSGEQFDSKIGQQYLRARYYDPVTGRFNRLDPFFGNLSDPQSLHKYLYTHADPVNGIDPSGKFGGVVGVGVSMSIGSGMQSKSAKTNVSAGYHAVCTIETLARIANLILLLVEIDNQLQGMRGGNPPNTAAEFLHDWITGRGPRTVRFDENTHLVQDMKNHIHVQQWRKHALNKAVQGNFGVVVKEWHSYSGFHGIPVAIKDALGMNGAWASAPILGSYELLINTSKNVQNNSVILKYKITNDMGLASATRIPVLGYLDDNHPLIKDWGFPQTLLNDTNEGPMKTKTMILVWEEEVPLNVMGN
jgi:RHS repeat-associated protein